MALVQVCGSLWLRVSSFHGNSAVVLLDPGVRYHECRCLSGLERHQLTAQLFVPVPLKKRAEGRDEADGDGEGG